MSIRFARLPPSGIALVAVVTLLASVSLGAQTLDSVMTRANAADAAGDHALAARLFERLYGLTGFDPSALAAAAVSAAKAGDDSLANRYFARAVREGFLDAGFLRYAETDTSIASVRRNHAWSATLAEAKRRVAELDRSLREELERLEIRDQQNRQRIGEIMTRYGRSSPQGDSAAREMERNDAPLLARLRAIIATRGWPGRSLVADDGAHAAWLVLQHAPLSVQRELLPTVRIAIMNGEGRLGDLALLEDRVLVGDGKPQIYGTQTRFAPSGGAPALDPIGDEPCVDRRRAAMGLEPLADYLRRFGVTYTPPREKCTNSSSSPPHGPPTRSEPRTRGVVHGVRVSPERLQLAIGGSMRVAASVDADAAVTVRGVTWRSNNLSVAAVGPDGTVIGASAGTATILATALADPNVKGVVIVTVTPRE